MDEEFLTVADVAQLLKLNQQTVRNWIDEGRMPAVRAGRRVRIRRADLDALLEASSTVPRTAKASSDERLAQRFWEGEYHPEPVRPETDG